MELKVIDKSFGVHSNSIFIESIEEGIKTIYDIRVGFDGMKVEVKGFGLKTSRQRNYRYPSCTDDWDYRKLNTKERKVFERNFISNSVPKDVLNLAVYEFVKEIIVMQY